MINRRDNAALASPFFGLGTLFFIWFLGYIRDYMRTAPEEASWIVSTFWAGGLLFAASLLLQGLVQLAQSSISDYGNDVVVAKALFALGAEAPSLTLAPMAAMTGAAGLIILRFKVLPKWIGWLSIAVFVGAFVAPLVPLFALWVLSVSVVVLIESREGSRAAVASQ
jgi:hypothetical protein